MITESRLIKFSFLAFLIVIIFLHWYIARMTPNPHYGKVFYKLGLECQNKCGLDEQLSYFQKAVFYDPNLVDAYYRMGTIYGKQGQAEKEFVAYKKVAIFDHTNANIYFKIGFYYFRKGELDYALRYFLQSDRYKPGLHETSYYLAQIYEKKQMYKEAVHWHVSVVAGRTYLSEEACKRIWRISKIPGQYEMVLGEVYRIYISHSREHAKLWEQVDRYIRTDEVPEFMRKLDDEGR